MKQLLFIFAFCVFLMTGNGSARDIGINKFTKTEHLVYNLNTCCSIDNSIDQFVIDDQESNEIDGFNFFVDDPEIQLFYLITKGFTIHPVVPSSSQFKLITLLSDLPPPRLS